jgi:hypothetical protein
MLRAVLCEPFRLENAFQRIGKSKHNFFVGAAMRRLALTLIPLLLVACRDAPTAPNLAQLTASQALRASAAAARASSTEFDGFVNTCSSTDPSRFKATPGGTVHFTASNTNMWVTGNPLIDGVEHNTVKVNINNKGQGVVQLDASLKPDAVNGTWEIQWHLSLPGFVGSGVGHGTGDLQGMTIKFTFDLAAGPSDCNPDGPKGHVNGVILSPAS